MRWTAVWKRAGRVAALVCENERGGRQVTTYAQLSHQVRQAAALRFRQRRERVPDQPRSQPRGIDHDHGAVLRRIHHQVATVPPSHRRASIGVLEGECDG